MVQINCFSSARKFAGAHGRARWLWSGKPARDAGTPGTLLDLDSHRTQLLPAVSFAPRRKHRFVRDKIFSLNKVRRRAGVSLLAVETVICHHEPLEPCAYELSSAS